MYIYIYTLYNDGWIPGKIALMRTFRCISREIGALL